MLDFLKIKDRNEVTAQHQELLETIENQVEDHPDNSDEEEWKLVNQFLEHYKDLFDDRTRKQKTVDLIDAKLSMNWGADYHAERQRYYPEEYDKKLPKKGTWVMIRTVLPVEEKYRNEKYDVYYAVPTPKTVSLGEGIRVPYYQVQVVINGQEVGVMPHEYVITDIKGVLEGIPHQWEMIRLGGTSNYDAGKVHYLGTRGISKEQVYNMLMGSIQSLNYCYYKLNPEAHEYFDFTFDCIERGIRPDMIDKLWLHKQTGKPLFTIKEDDKAPAQQG